MLAAEHSPKWLLESFLHIVGLDLRTGHKQDRDALKVFRRNWTKNIGLGQKQLIEQTTR